MHPPDWISSELITAIMGPGGAILAIVVAGKIGFTFLTRLLEKQDEKYQKQVDRLDKLHVRTLEHMHDQTLATSLQTETLKNLSEKIQASLDERIQAALLNR